MQLSIIIESIHYSGETAQIQFQPYGSDISINLGSVVLPYDFIPGNLTPPQDIYGTYTILTDVEPDCPYYLNIVPPTPTTTPTPTVTKTQTPTLTITSTPTPTFDICAITETPTPTITPTPTPTMVPLVSEVIYGKLNKLTINENDVVQFNKLKTNDVLSTYVHYDAIPGYCYMLVPITDNQPTLFRNSNESCGGFVIPFLKLNDITIIDSNEKVIIYCVYRSFVSTKASVDVWVCE
jgi:hypothetical protein